MTMSMAAGAAGTGVAASGRSERSLPSLLFIVILAIVVWIVAAPLIMLLYSSFGSDPNKLPFESTSLTLNNYWAVVSGDTFRTVVLNTLIFTVGSTAIGIGVAIYFAWLIERTDIWFRRLFFVAMLIPMVIPSMIYAMSWTQLLAPNNGLVVLAMRRIGLDFLVPNLYSMTAMVLIQGFLLASHAYLLIAISFRNLDPSWEEQSFVAGRRKLQTVLRVTIPMLKPALLAAVLFFTVVSLETFEIPVTLGMTSKIQVASTYIYWNTRPEGGQLPNYGLSSALAVMLLAVTFALISVYHWQTRNPRNFTSITGKGFQQRRVRLDAWKLPHTLIATAFLFVAVALPLFMLVWRSLNRFYSPPSLASLSRLNFDAYRAVFADPVLPQILNNTLLLVIGAAGTATVLAAAVAWQIVRGSATPRLRRTLTTLAFLPQSFPSVVVGLSLVFVYISLPFAIYGTLWLLWIGMVTKYLAYSVGMVIAGQRQISPELEEASLISGGGARRTYLRIILPLIAPSLVGCFIWVSVQVIRELGLTLMLYSISTQVISTKIWLQWDAGRIPEASATGVMTIVLLFILLSTIRIGALGLRILKRQVVAASGAARTGWGSAR
ncbi:MAG: iron ABC transporter permease [Rhizobiaceae bacterium]|nr:iron ABC transporter permease [Rhizobiaceae bacterium]